MRFELRRDRSVVPTDLPVSKHFQTSRIRNHLLLDSDDFWCLHSVERMIDHWLSADVHLADVLGGQRRRRECTAVGLDGEAFSFDRL